MKRYFKSLNEFIGELSKAKCEEEHADTLVKYAVDRLAHCFEVHDIETAILLIKICKYINPRHFQVELIPDDEDEFEYVDTIEDEDGNEVFRVVKNGEEYFLERDDPDEGLIRISVDDFFEQIEEFRRKHKDETFRN